MHEYIRKKESTIWGLPPHSNFDEELPETVEIAMQDRRDRCNFSGKETQIEFSIALFNHAKQTTRRVDAIGELA